MLKLLESSPVLNDDPFQYILELIKKRRLWYKDLNGSSISKQNPLYFKIIIILKRDSDNRLGSHKEVRK